MTWVTGIAVIYHDLSQFLIRFPDGFLIPGIRFYGLSYIAGFLTGWALLHLYYKKGRSPLNPDRQFDLIFYLILGVALGGRIGYTLLYDLPATLHDPVRIIQVWRGGMASHGGMIGVALALLWFARRQRLPVMRVSDLVCTVASAGILFGRIANFINGELWGKPADVPWAVAFREYHALTGTWEYGVPRHPSQLYQAGLEGLLLLLYMQARFWTGKHLRFGRLTGEYLIGYAILRIFGEIFREPDRGVTLILGMSRGTFYSLFLIAGGLAAIAFSRKQPSHPNPGSGDATPPSAPAPTA